jgi:predicted nucleotidyltransferase component of viral defense system
MDFERIEKIKRLAIISLFVDDELMDMLALKGGNALDIVYGISPRASIDLDLSIEDDFDADEIDSIRRRIERALQRIFNENGFEVF